MIVADDVTVQILQQIRDGVTSLGSRDVDDLKGRVTKLEKRRG